MKNLAIALMSIWTIAAVYTAQKPVEDTETVEPKVDTIMTAENVWATITDVPEKQTKLTIDAGDRCMVTVEFEEAVEKPVPEPEPVPEPTPEPVPVSTGKHLWGVCTITHYCNCQICCGQWAGGGTASGTIPTPNRTVACGALPFGTRLEINGQQYVVEDTGVNGMWVDIFVSSHDEALARGMYQTEVWILE